MNDRLNRRQFTIRAAQTTAAVLAAPRVLASGATEAASTSNWGDLTGRFVYDGSPPPRKKLIVDKDVECCGKFDIRDESLMVDADGGLANVYIYLRGRKVEVCPELTASVEDDVLLDNRDCIFMPHCMKIWTAKQELKIVNSDPVAQNVAFSPLGDKPANIVLPAPPDKAATAKWRFSRAQRRPLPVVCNYHPWEIAYILPLDHPYCDVSRKDGAFRIAKLPPGRYEFQVWHERPGYLETPDWKGGRFTVTIRPGVTDLGTIRLAPSLFSNEP
ncbi:MAG: hypothetical protein GX621_00725 [Pirellulaceae bacterium]|nr:hypothetical protein [Pirellulaceae bacterium]